MSTNFKYDNPLILHFGRLQLNGAYYNLSQDQNQIRFDCDAAEVALQIYANDATPGNCSFDLSIDGGATFQTIQATTAQDWYFHTLYSDGPHSVVVKNGVNLFIASPAGANSGTLVRAASDGATLSMPAGFGAVYDVQNVIGNIRCGGGAALNAGIQIENGRHSYAHGTFSQADGSMAFYASLSEMWLTTYTGNYVVSVDGKIVENYLVVNDNQFLPRLICDVDGEGNPLDPGEEHLFKIYFTGGAKGYVTQIMAVGGTLNTTTIPPALPVMAGMGDSIMAGGYVTDGAPGWLVRLADKLGYDAYNLGVGGNTSTQALARALDATDLNPAVILLMIGQNDEMFGVDVPTHTANIEGMLEAWHGAIPQVEVWQMGIIRANGNTSTDNQYNDADAATIASYLSANPGRVARFLDTRDLAMASGDFADGLHPLGGGYLKMANYAASGFAEPATGDETIMYFSNVGPHTRAPFNGGNVLSLSAPEGSSVLKLQAGPESVRYTLDGSTPTAQHGFYLSRRENLTLPLGAAMVVKIFSPSGSNDVNYQWGAYSSAP